MPGLELLEIVGVHARQSKRGGEKAWRFRREIEAGGIRATNDRSQPQERRSMRSPSSSIITSKVQASPRWLQKTPSISNGAPPKLLGDRMHFRRRDEQEDRRRDRRSGG